MSVLAFALAVGVGGVVGVVSGLLGIGGGVLMVPFLYYLMAQNAWSGLDVPVDHQAALAHATSLAVIVPTALSALREFLRAKVVTWSLVVPLGASAAVAALVGAQVAASLPTPILKLAFGLFLLASGGRLLLPRSGVASVAADGEASLRRSAALFGGGLVGFLSALLGVGGGIVAIPILIRWARLDLHRVVPASIGIIVFAATAGVASYMLAGLGVSSLPSGAVGFVHVPAAAAMIPGAVLAAPVGARWNQRLPTTTLRPLFSLLLLAVGLQLVWANGRVLLE